MKNVLFICSQNRLRSPTAEALFEGSTSIAAHSAGTEASARLPVTEELIQWADEIYVMESRHARRLKQQFPDAMRRKRLICLSIPDRYSYMEPELVRILKARLAPYLPAPE